MTREITIGVLALQGAFKEHVNVLERISSKFTVAYTVIEVRTVEELRHSDALVIPGGESTSISLVAERTGLLAPLRQFVQDGKPVWGTCAGLILLANEATGAKQGQELIGGLDVSVIRNHFGRQLESFTRKLNLAFLEDGEEKEYNCVFIRAPVVDKAGKNVQILAQVDNVVVAVKQGNIFGTAFHPELTPDTRIHEYWVSTFL